MARLQWDTEGQRFYETGVSNGVLFVKKSGTYQKGVAWNGLISVSESPSGAETTALYADNIKYLSLMSTEEFGATIEAYTYPEEFMTCDGSASIATGVFAGQQTRDAFGLVYKTLLGNDSDGVDHGYKLHIIYNCLAAPTEKGYQTVNDSPEAITFSWEVTTTPVEIPGFKPSATIIIDSTKVAAGKMKAIEDLIFGADAKESSLPTPAEIITLMGTAHVGEGEGN